MAPLTAFVEGVGVLAPGLSGWAQSRPVLAGKSVFDPFPLELPRVDLLPAAERRRTGAPVKLAMWVGQDALSHCAQEPEHLATVFTSSGGDGDVIHEICSALSAAEREISPTRFHNSVHNAPAGYWGVATRSHAPSTSLCCFDWSFAAGLMEALAQIKSDYPQVLLISFDTPYPEPIHSVRAIDAPFGSALLLTRDKSARSLGAISLQLATGLSESRMSDRGLETLRQGNPSARALPLLAALAVRQVGNVILDYLCGSQLKIALSQC